MTHTITERSAGGDKNVSDVLYSVSQRLSTTPSRRLLGPDLRETRPDQTLKFSNIFPKRLGIFSPNFTCLLHVPIYAGL